MRKYPESSARGAVTGSRPNRPLCGGVAVTMAPGRGTPVSESDTTPAMAADRVSVRSAKHHAASRVDSAGTAKETVAVSPTDRLIRRAGALTPSSPKRSW